MQNQKIAVVGYGIAGASAAFLLRKMGYQVTVFEQSEQLSAKGAGVLLQPSGQWILQKMGLPYLDLRRANKIDTIKVKKMKTNRDFFSLSYDEYFKGAFAVGAKRGDIFMSLLAAGKNFKLPIHTQKKITRMEIDSDQAFLYCQNRTKYGPFDWVLACDGAGSQLAHQSEKFAWEYRYPEGVVWLVRPVQASPGKLLQRVEGTRLLMGLLPTGSDQTSFFCSISKKEWELQKQKPFGQFRDTVIRKFPEAAPVFEGLDSYEPFIYTGYKHIHMRSWIDEKIVFLGDAAHGMSPHLGQGINLALEDAWFFCESVKKTNKLSHAALLYEKNRKRKINFYSTVTFLLSPFFQSRLPGLSLLRSVGLPTLKAIKVTKNLMLSSLLGIRTGLFDRPCMALLYEVSRFYASPFSRPALPATGPKTKPKKRWGLVRPRKYSSFLQKSRQQKTRLQNRKGSVFWLLERSPSKNPKKASLSKFQKPSGPCMSKALFLNKNSLTQLQLQLRAKSNYRP